VREKAILVIFDWDKKMDDAQGSALELAELSKAAGLEVARSFICPLREPNARYFFGRGKAEEISLAAKEEEADTVIFDADLSATQQRNLEEVLNVKTIDRTQLILDIFAMRARSIEGRLQVELAQLKYLLPRLGGQGLYLSRLGGGVGTRGPGEQKLEMDRRRLRERVTKLGAELKSIQNRRQGAIEKKKEKGLPLISLVGYTNTGKSTLFNRLTSANVLVKDQLFSTLDTTTRLLTLPGNQKSFLADTVGFVRRLPHHLVESFKATLEETIHADILLHVLDATSTDIPGVLDAVNDVLGNLGVSDENVLVVMNKIDLLDEEGLSRLKARWGGNRTHFISARAGLGLEALLDSLVLKLPQQRTERDYFIPKKSLGLVHCLYEQGEVLSRKDGPEGAMFRVRLTKKESHQFEKKLKAS
jgi:GTP-binding protein HflX